MTPEAAEAAALRVLGWIAGNDEILPVFLGSSGVGLADIKARAGDPDFLASVMDFILMDDAWVLGAAEDCRMRPEEFVQIRAGLPGGALPHWT